VDKKQAEEITNEVLVTDCLLQLKALENLLIAKGLIDKNEFELEIKKVAKELARSLLEKSNFTGNVDDILEAF
jgi:hypothetical protein